MSLNVDTISGSVEHECPERLFLGGLEYRSTKENFVVDGTKPGLISAIKSTSYLHRRN
jgi:hypothetical protein